jgi:hypothetical protein
VSALLTLALLLAPPGEDASAPPAPAPSAPEAPLGVPEAPRASPTEPSASEPTPTEPTLEPPAPTLPTSTDPGSYDDEPEPQQPHNPRGPTPAPPPEPPEPEPDEYAPRDLANMPLAPTAARKSATQRNNLVLVRPFRKPLYSVAANARFGTLLGGGRDVMQPYGYGFAAALRLYFAPTGKARFGVELHAGHTRWPQAQRFPTIDGEATIKRVSLLSDTDFSAGPSFSLPIGPLFIEFGGSAGVALSTLFRPQSADAIEDQLVSTSNFMLRGGAGIGIPLLNQHGLHLGAGVHHIFSPREVAIDPSTPDSETTRPFGTWLEVSLGYEIWF